LGLSAGQYVFAVSGGDASPDPTLVCQATGISPIRKSVQATLIQTADGSDWIVRPTVASDTLEIRFRDAGYQSMVREAVTGTISGRLADTSVLIPGATSGNGVIVDFSPQGSPAAITGLVTVGAGLQYIGARADGGIQFIDVATGKSSMCPAVELSWQRFH
jgi:hypothetical protein